MYVVIVWETQYDADNTNGAIYGWYENPVTAQNTATNLVQFGTAVKAVALKPM